MRQLIFAVDKFLIENSDKVSEEDRATLESAAKEAKEKLANAKEPEEIKDITDELAKVTNPIFTKLYQDAQQAQGEGSSVNVDPESGDSTIDVDPSDIN